MVLLIRGIIVGIACFVAVGYLIPYLTYHQTKISKDEVVIGRVTGFMEATTYSVDRRTGDERLVIFGLTPISGHKYLTIDYSGSCRCVSHIYQSGNGTTYYATRNLLDGTVYVSSGQAFTHSQMGPPSLAKDKFDEARNLLEKTRIRYGLD